MSNPLVTKFKCIKDETQTFFEWNDLADSIIKTMGFDMWDVIQILKDREVEKGSSNEPSMITYIEDGVFSEQIKESRLVNRIADVIISNLDEQGYLRKNRNTSNFEVPEDELAQMVDEELSPGMMNYFDKED